MLIGCLYVMLGKPEAHIENMEHLGSIVQFKWYGFPVPIIYGAFRYEENGTAYDAMNHFLFSEGHIWFAISAWLILFFAISIVLAIAVEYCTRKFISSKTPQGKQVNNAGSCKTT